MADFADKRDSQCLPSILDQVVENLKWDGLEVEEVLADSAYSSGSSLRYLEKAGIQAYIPCIGIIYLFEKTLHFTRLVISTNVKLE